MDKKKIIALVLIVVLLVACVGLTFVYNSKIDKISGVSTSDTSKEETSDEKESTNSVTEDNTKKVGWQKDENGSIFYKEDGTTYSSELATIEDKTYYFNENGYMTTGWQYVNNLKYYFDENGAMVEDVTEMVKAPYEIKVNRAANCVTVYAKDGEKGFIIPVKAFICSTGGDKTPLGTFKTSNKYRWRELFGASGQYATRIDGHILFHSIPYSKLNDAHSLKTAEYNKLGTPASDGCVRLAVKDAKWIYDNCSSGTTVTIYDDSENVGPFERPTFDKIPDTQNYDPTDLEA